MARRGGGPGSTTEAPTNSISTAPSSPTKVPHTRRCRRRKRAMSTSAKAVGEPVVLHRGPYEIDEIDAAAMWCEPLVSFCGASRVPIRSPYPDNNVSCDECVAAWDRWDAEGRPR